MATIFGERELIEEELVDVIQPDTGRAGGITPDEEDRRDGGGAPHHDGAAFRLARPGRRIRRAAPDGRDPQRPDPGTHRGRLGGAARRRGAPPGAARMASSPCRTRPASAATSTRSSCAPIRSQRQCFGQPMSPIGDILRARAPATSTSMCRRACARGALFDPCGGQVMRIDRMRVFMTRDKDRPRVIVALDTDDGLTGWGECYNHGPDKALPPLLDYLMGFLAGEDPTRGRTPGQPARAAVPLPAGRARAGRHLGHRPLPVGHLGQGALRAGLPAARRLTSATGSRSIPASTPRPTCPRRARRSTSSTSAGASSPSSSSPWRIDMHANRWGEVVRDQRRLFPRPEDGDRSALRDRLRRACQDLRAGAGAPARQCARPIRSAVLRGAAEAGEHRRLGRAQAAGSTAGSPPASRSTTASSSSS